MASSSSSSSSSLSHPRPLLQTRRDLPEEAMATPQGAPETRRIADHGGNLKVVPCRHRRQKSEILPAQYIDVRELRICVGTWNVGSICPPSDLDIQEWLDTEELADIYVAGFQEIIPLEAGYMIGAEDNRPVAVWDHIIGETLNKKCSEQLKFKCHSAPPSPSRSNPSDYALEMNDELLSEANNSSDGGLHELTEQHTNIDTSNSDSESLGLIWPEKSLDMFAHHLRDSAKSSTPARRLQPLDLAYDVNIDTKVKRRRPQFVRIMSKQMVGVFLSIWVRRSLQKHIQNLRISILGVGRTPYIGNKGSISVSMSIHQTNFCFVCCHLAAGEKEGDELKRNANVEAIHRRTVFNPVPIVRVPQRINDHERIIWLGDLNYRINLPYERTHELICKEDWDRLFEKDQLNREFRKGCTFDGWVEGVIKFPPTYKYEFNSGNYVSDATKSGRRTPAWCDRILSYGKGIKLLSYRRAELTFSDHRPVTAVYMAEVQVLCHRKLQRALRFTNAEVEDHLLLGQEALFEQKAFEYETKVLSSSSY